MDGRTMDVTVQVRDDGSFVLPECLRKRYGIEPGKTLHLLDLDGVLVLATIPPTVEELSRGIERARNEAGLSVEELLDGLREQRERYYQEKYGPARA